MIRLLFIIAIAAFLYLFLRGLFSKRTPPSARSRRSVETFRDPVCGVYVTVDDAVAGKLENGENVFFCSMDCLEKFRQDLENKASEHKEPGGSK
jgi:YHS domain-containing protein